MFRLTGVCLGTLLLFFTSGAFSESGAATLTQGVQKNASLTGNPGSGSQAEAADRNIRLISDRKKWRKGHRGKRRHFRNRHRKVHGRHRGNRRYHRGHRRYHGRHYRHRHDRFGPEDVFGIIGGLIVDEAYRDSNRSAFEKCDARYRSFRWSDGTFKPYNGPRRLCPYLIR